MRTETRPSPVGPTKRIKASSRLMNRPSSPLAIGRSLIEPDPRAALENRKTATLIRRTRVPPFCPSSRQHGSALSNWDLLSLTISINWQPANAASRPLSVHPRRLATGSCSAERSDSRYATVIDPTGRAADAVGSRVGTHVEGRSEFGCGQASVNAPQGTACLAGNFSKSALPKGFRPGQVHEWLNRRMCHAAL